MTLIIIERGSDNNSVLIGCDYEYCTKNLELDPPPILEETSEIAEEKYYDPKQWVIDFGTSKGWHVASYNGLDINDTLDFCEAHHD